MILVAVAAVATGAEVMRRRRAEFLSRAESSAARERFHQWDRDYQLEPVAEQQRKVDWLSRKVAEQPDDEPLRQLRDRFASDLSVLKADVDDAARSTAYDAAMRRKYERAARYPWLPVDRDPPESVKATKKPAVPDALFGPTHPPRF
jgi:hypothetical protein